MDKYKKTSYNEETLSRDFQDSTERDFGLKTSKIEVEHTDFDSGVMSGSFLNSSSMLLSSSSGDFGGFDEERKDINDEERQEEMGKEICSEMSLDSGLQMDSGVNIISESPTDKKYMVDKIIEEEPEETREEEHTENVLGTLQDEDGDTPLHLYIADGNETLVHRLISNLSILINLPNKLNQTPLHLAVLTENLNISRHLVLSGAKMEYQDHNGNTPLHLAARAGKYDMMRVLTIPQLKSEMESVSREKPAYKFNRDVISVRNYEGLTCMHLAALSGDMDCLRYLKELGGDINIREGKSGQTILHYFVQTQQIEAIYNALVQCTASVSTPNYARKTPLGLAKRIRDCKPWDRTAQKIVFILRKYGNPIKAESEDDNDNWSSEEDDFTSDDE